MKASVMVGFCMACHILHSRRFLMLWMAFVLLASLAVMYEAVAAGAESSSKSVAGQDDKLTMRLATAERQGRCRSLAYHLLLLEKAKKKNARAEELKVLGLLAGGMMNGFPVGGEVPANSQVSTIVFTRQGRSKFQNARRKLLDQIHAVRKLNGEAAASQIAASCISCHSSFMADAGRSALLPNRAALSSLLRHK